MNVVELQVIVIAPGALASAATPLQPGSAPGGRLLQLALSRATAVAGHAVTAVLGAHSGDLAPALGRLPVSVVVNREWREGLAAAIRAGLASLPGSCGGALLWPADQSGVTSADLQRLVDAARRNPRSIVAAQYGGGRGLPAVFPRSEFASLLALRGDAGLAALLRSPAAGLIGVPMPAAAPVPAATGS